MSTLARFLRLVSTIACAIVIVSFAMFAYDEANGAETQQVQKLDEQSTRSSGGDSGEAKHGQPRRAIDDANDTVTEPFQGIVDGSSSRWVRRGVPALLALLVYGVLARLLIADLPGVRR